MYLTRIVLNPLNRQVQTEIARPYEMHRTILRAFPSDMDREAERVLWRVDTHPRTGALHLLVQSQQAPDWQWLEADGAARTYLARVDDVNPAVKSVGLQLDIGQILAFRLLGNPTKRLGKAYGKDKGKRVGLYAPDDQIKWLARKAGQSGFAVLSAIPQAGAKTEDAQRKLELFGVRFDGLLRVIDAERLQQAILQGIGSGKAFGFGMLSLAPPPR